MKLWHDDVRKPPNESWTWARTNHAAISILRSFEIEEASLDHDLGLEHLDPNGPGVINLRGSSPDGSGYDLAKWMVENNKIPKKVTCHSWSPAGAKRMAKVLLAADSGAEIVVKPYTPTTGIQLYL